MMNTSAMSSVKLDLKKEMLLVVREHRNNIEIRIEEEKMRRLLGCMSVT